MGEAADIRLIVGLGNVGREYEETRHNIGFLVVEEFARIHGWPWKIDNKFLGRYAKGSIDGQSVILLEPATYMNESGRSVRRVMDYYKLDAQQVLVICDDIDIPFVSMRLREKGGPGTHNGLKSVQQHVGPNYARLRLGVGAQQGKKTLTSHVLGKFTADEQQALSTFIEAAGKVCTRIAQGDDWQAILRATNVRPKRAKVPKDKVEKPRGNDEQRREDKPL